MSTRNNFPMTWEQSVEWLRNKSDQEQLVKACYFDDPIEEAAMRYYNEDEWQAVRNLLPSQKGHVLDVGSGRGISAFALAKDGWEVTALEPDPSALVGRAAIEELAFKTKVKIKVVSEWGEQLPFSNESFEAIHARQVLHHAHDLNQFCRELFRVCKPGGLLIATREHVIDSKKDLPRFLNSHPLHRLYGGENAYLLCEYETALNEAGFQILSTLSPLETPINYFPATKKDVDQIILKIMFGRFSRFYPFPVPRFIISLISKNRLKSPGRLYSFVVRKPAISRSSNG